MKYRNRTMARKSVFHNKENMYDFIDFFRIIFCSLPLALFPSVQLYFCFIESFLFCSVAVKIRMKNNNFYYFHNKLRQVLLECFITQLRDIFLNLFFCSLQCGFNWKISRLWQQSYEWSFLSIWKCWKTVGLR